jgi:hypothetical protein
METILPVKIASVGTSSHNFDWRSSPYVGGLGWRHGLGLYSSPRPLEDA